MRVFSDGSLPQAMRASMSLPGVFAPIEIDDRLYVDGGLVRNLPVDVARQHGRGPGDRRQRGQHLPAA